jgi:hypothetical protein
MGPKIALSMTYRHRLDTIHAGNQSRTDFQNVTVH